MLILDIANYLIGTGDVFAPGGASPSVFSNWRPEAPDKIVVVSDYTSIEPVVTMNGAAHPIVERPRLQVLVRDEAQEVVACYNKARDIYKHLCLVVDLVIGTTRYTLVPLDNPSMTGRDDQQRVLYSMNFQATMQE